MKELRLRHDGVAWKDVDGEVVALDEHAAPDDVLLIHPQEALGR